MALRFGLCFAHDKRKRTKEYIDKYQVKERERQGKGEIQRERERRGERQTKRKRKRENGRNKDRNMQEKYCIQRVCAIKKERVGNKEKKIEQREREQDEKRME